MAQSNTLPVITLPAQAQKGALQKLGKALHSAEVKAFIAEKYGVLIEALYGGKTEQYIETQVKFEDGRSGSVSATLKLGDAKTFAPVKAAA